MDSPPSVITTLVVFSLFILMGIYVIYQNLTLGFTHIVFSLILPIVFIIGWIGVYLRKNWSRYYCSIIIIIFGLFELLAPFFGMNKGDKTNEHGAIIVTTGIFLAFAWWAYSLAFGKAAKEYFKQQ